MSPQHPSCSCSLQRRCFSANHCATPGSKSFQHTSPILTRPSLAPRAKQPPSPAASAAPPAPASGLVVPVHVFWDLDNIRVPHMGHLPLVARRLLRAVEQHVLPGLGAADGCPLPPEAVVAGGHRHLTAFANEHTLARLRRGDTSSHDAQALAALSLSLALQGGRLVVVPVRRNSADLAMSGDMERLARQLAAASGGSGPDAASDSDGSTATPPPAVLACASNDVGFAPSLRYAAAHGLATVAVTDPLRTQRRPSWALPPDYGRYPLPAAAGRCLVWDDRWLPPPEDAGAEAALAQAWAVATGLPPPPLPCAGGVARSWVRRSAEA